METVGRLLNIGNQYKIINIIEREEEKKMIKIKLSVTKKYV